MLLLQFYVGDMNGRIRRYRKNNLVDSSLAVSVSFGHQQLQCNIVQSQNHYFSLSYSSGSIIDISLDNGSSIYIAQHSTNRSCSCINHTHYLSALGCQYLLCAVVVLGCLSQANHHRRNRRQRPHTWAYSDRLTDD